MNRIAVIALTLTLAACSHTGYQPTPGQINVVALDGNGKLIYRPLTTDLDRVLPQTEAVQCWELAVNVC